MDPARPKGWRNLRRAGLLAFAIIAAGCTYIVLLLLRTNASVLPNSIRVGFEDGEIQVFQNFVWTQPQPPTPFFADWVGLISQLFLTLRFAADKCDGACAGHPWVTDPVCMLGHGRSHLQH